ncbi:MAG TPA: integrin alpha [Planctomycetota bacterium]|nr:integrin alpha [Planctomycetota bacterium]
MFSLAVVSLAGVSYGQVRISRIDQLCSNPSWCGASAGAPRHVGWSIAGVGDVDGDGRDDLAVGANLENGPSWIGGTNGGYVRILTGAGEWVFSTIAPVQSSAHFGESLAALGDLDSDGVQELAVGASHYDTPGVVDRGAVFVVSLAPSHIGTSGVAAGIVAPSATLAVHLGAVGSARFGAAVAGGRDLDGDGIGDLAIGAPEDGRNGPGAGEVRVVSTGPGGTVLHSVLGNPGSRFGKAVALLEDMDGDGVGEFLGCGPLDGSVAPQQGRAVVYSGASGAALHVLHGDSSFDEFGQSACRLGDLDGDGKAEFAVGSPRATPGPHWSAGRIHVFDGASAVQLFTIDGPRANARLGTSVASAGDVDLDGTPDILGGGTHDAVAGAEAGFAGVYSGAGGGLIYERLGEFAGERLGHAVAGVGDATGDGYPDVAVGAPFADRDPNSGAKNGLVLLETLDRIPSATAWRPSTPLPGFTAGVDVVGDIDGDGRRDFVAGVFRGFYGAAGPYVVSVQAYSFRSSSPLHSTDHVLANSQSLVPTGLRDLDADGAADYAVGFPAGTAAFSSRALVCSAATGAVLHTILEPGRAMGRLVADVGDVTGDGVGDVLVTSVGADCRSLVVSGATGATHFALTTAVSNLPSDATGIGDVNGDGFDDVLVGHRQDDFVASTGYVGAARVHSGADGAWLRGHTGTPQAWFGASVLALPDINGDGIPDYAVGAPFDDAFGTDHGAVRAYGGAVGAELWATAGTPVAPSNYFGFRMRTCGDVNGDGVADLVVAQHGGVASGSYGVQVVSAVDGATLEVVPSFGTFLETGDVDDDGTTELVDVASGPWGFESVVRARSTAGGAVRYGEPRVAGQALTLGWRVDAAAGGLLTTAGAAPGAPGFVIASSGARAEYLPAFDLPLLVGLQDAVVAPLSFDAGGVFTTPLSLRIPSLAGVGAYLQAFAPSSPVSGAWSNGVVIRFGP